MVERQAGANGVTIGRDPTTSDPARRRKARMRQILLNLLSNAVKFTPRGTTVRMIAFIDERSSWCRSRHRHRQWRRTSHAPWSASVSGGLNRNTKAPASDLPSRSWPSCMATG
jgi:hypothetical protein